MFNKRLLSLVLAGGLILGFASLSMAGVPDAGQSEVAFINLAPDLITDPGLGDRGVTIYPDGSGPSLLARQCDMELTIRDANGLEVPAYPFQDIWTDDAGSGLVNLCPGGSTADADTDNFGYTTISGVISGGGTNNAGMSVYVSGVALTTTVGGTDTVLDFWVNSPDINGDHEVALGDITLFSNDLTLYNYRSDYNWDGAVDLSDITLFSNAIGNAFCP